MKVKDLYGLDDHIEHFVIHTAEEELASVKIENVEIKKTSGSIVFNFYVDRFDGVSSNGRQEDLSEKLQKRINKFHKNFIKNVEVNVLQV